MTALDQFHPPADLMKARQFIAWFEAQEHIPVTSPRRLKKVIQPRRLVWLALSIMGYSTVQVGKLFGRDHSTVVQGLASIRKDPRADAYARAYIRAFADESEELMGLLREAAQFIRRAPGALALLEDHRG